MGQDWGYLIKSIYPNDQSGRCILDLLKDERCRGKEKEISEVEAHLCNTG